VTKIVKKKTQEKEPKTFSILFIDVRHRKQATYEFADEERRKRNKNGG